MAEGVSWSLSGGDARWIEYLISGEIIGREVGGCVDDPFFWAVG